jgi:hypothetical protein
MDCRHKLGSISAPIELLELDDEPSSPGSPISVIDLTLDGPSPVQVSRQARQSHQCAAHVSLEPDHRKGSSHKKSSESPLDLKPDIGGCVFPLLSAEDELAHFTSNIGRHASSILGAPKRKLARSFRPQVVEDEEDDMSDVCQSTPLIQAKKRNMKRYDSPRAAMVQAQLALTGELTSFAPNPNMD